MFNDPNGDAVWDSGSLLVSSIANDKVIRYSATTGAFIDVFAGGDELHQPNGLAWGPDGNLYVASEGGNSILRYSGTTGAFLGVFASGGPLHLPVNLAFGSDGNLYVTNTTQPFSIDVLRYNGSTGSFLGAFIAAGSGGLDHPASMTFGPDGDFYVSSANTHQILRYDGGTGAFLGPFVTLPDAGSLNVHAFGPAIAFGPDGDLYVADQGDNHAGLPGNQVLRYDGHTGAPKGVFVSSSSGGIIGPSGMAFGPDGNLYLVSTLTDQVFRYSGATGAFIDIFVTANSGGLSIPEKLIFAPTPEPGLPGWVVYLDDNRNGRRDPGERFTTTDASGNYSFTGLAPGTYVVAEEPQLGWVQTAPPGRTHTVTLASGQVVTGEDFGNQRITGPTVNHPPTFTSPAPTVATVGQLFRSNATAFDPDGDPLTYDLVVKPDGMAVDPSTGVIVWVPFADQIGTHDVTLRVQDGRGGFDLQSFRIAVGRPNSTPVITSVPHGPAVAGTPYQYQVLAQDADGDPITFRLDSAPPGMTIDAATGLIAWTPTAGQVGSKFVAVTASDDRGAATTQSFGLPIVAVAPNDPPRITSTPRGSVRIGDRYLYSVQAADPNGDPLSFSLPTAPAGMTIDAGGLVQWTPTADQFGCNSVQVRVADGRGGSVTQTFSVSVTAQASNQPPVVTSTPPQGATVGRLYAYDLGGGDPDGDPLTWGLDAAPAGMSIDPSRGTLRWTPTADQLGSQNVVLRLLDGQGGFDTQSFTIDVRAVDVPPNVVSTPPTEAAVGSAYSYAVQAADADGDPLTFFLTAAPAGMSIDAATGLIRWTPTAAQLGAQDVALRVEDGQGGFGTQTWTIVVSATAINRPPVIASDPVLTATVGQGYQYAVAAADPEGKTVLFSLRSGPAGMSIDPSSGLIQWTPTAAQVGSQTVTVAAVDPQGAAGFQTFAVAVASLNHDPTISSHPVQVVTAGLPYRYDVRATDPDGDPLSYRLDAAPAGMTIDALGRTAWAPGIPDVGTRRVAVTVSDDRGASITQTYDLAVLADAQTPRVSLFVSANPADLNSPVTFVASATDNVGVQSLVLTINGQALALDAQGRATVLADRAGDFAVELRVTDAAGNVGLATTTLSVIDRSDVNAPQVDITSPIDNAVVTAPVDVVGTAADDNLLYYKLEVAPVSGGPFSEVFRGTTAVVNGVLGRFDPSGLADDAYTLRLTAVDAGGNSSVVEQTINVAGDLKLGNFTLSFTDLTVPVSGIPISVSRTYDSLNAGSDGELGFGWRLEFRDTNLHTSLAPTGEEDLGVYTPFRDKARVYLTLPGGKREGFTFTPRVQSVFGAFTFYHPAFTADPGVTDRLSVPDYVLQRDAFGDYYGLVGDGSLAYNPADDLNFGGQYFLTTKDGAAYTIDSTTGELTSVADAHGNTLTYSDAAIDSSTGQRVTFGRDPQGRITSVSDPSGVQVRYTYDAKGDLVSVTDRDGNATHFVYDAPRPHYLTQVIDPLGRTGVRTEYNAQGRLTQLVDAAGKTVQLAYDPDHSTETVRDALGNPTTFEYDERGNVVTQIDALGGIMRRSYDANNNLLTETDPLGHTTAYTYDGDGNVLTQTDPLGKVTRNTYTTTTPGFFARIAGARPVSLLQTTTDPLGDATTNSYDGAGDLLASTDAAGAVTRYTYDGAGNQTAIIDAAGGVTTFAYDAAGRLLRQTDALGHDTAYAYDGNGNLLTQTTTLTTPSGVRTLTTTTVYDANGRPTSVTDAEGNVTRTEYDALGRQTATVDALGHRTEFVYDERGQLVQTRFADGTSASLAFDDAGRRVRSTDRAGRVTRFEYDALGRLVTTIYPDGTPIDLTDNPRTQTEYDAAGEVTAQIDERGDRTRFVYDADGRQTAVINALGQETDTTYDGAGRAVAMTDALGHTTRFVLDALGRQVQTVFVDGSSTLRGYDSLGRPVAETDQDGRTTHYEYDSLGRLAAVVDALGQRTEYGYDEAGDLVSQKDADGHVTRYEYDSLGRRTATVLPMGERSTTTYDGAGDVASTTDFNGATVHFQYDRNNRLTAQFFPDASTVTYTYTVTGQQASVVDGRGVTTYAYDERDRLLSRTDPDGTRIAYTYDAAGNRTSVTTPAGTTTYTFDALNRLATATDPSLGVTRYAYDADGNLVRTDAPNGTAETRTYDALNRLTYLENDGPSGVVSSYRYTLDAAGNRIAVVEDTGRRVDYSYDALYRLTREAIADAIFGDRTIDYTYDAVGNRLVRNDSAEGRTVSTYDADDHLLTEDLAGQITRYTYDANGNTLSRIVSAADEAFYHWDFQNRLVGADVTDASGTHHTVNQYDADGIRVAQMVDGVETRFLIDANRPYAEVLMEYRPSGLIVASYVYGNGLILQDRGGVRSYYSRDGLGGTRALTNGSGVVTDRYTYDAFGRTIGQSGNTVNAYMFAGEQRDANVGLDYLRARYLSVGTGRFTSTDRVDADPEIPGSLNRYLYVFNNPINLLDPAGSWPPAIHSQLLYTAFEVTLHPWQIKILKDTSENQDAWFHHDGHITGFNSGGQSALFAYEHAMSSKYYDAHTAEALYYGFLNNNLQQARILQLAGWSTNSPQFLTLLGKNLHAIADRTSPVHSGFQLWNPYDLHSYLTYHEPGEKTIAPDVFAKTVEDLRAEYMRFVGVQGIQGKNIHDIVSVLTNGLRLYQNEFNTLR